MLAFADLLAASHTASLQCLLAHLTSAYHNSFLCLFTFCLPSFSIISPAPGWQAESGYKWDLISRLDVSTKLLYCFSLPVISCLFRVWRDPAQTLRCWTLPLTAQTTQRSCLMTDALRADAVQCLYASWLPGRTRSVLSLPRKCRNDP